jgi:hypothetical protein
MFWCKPGYVIEGGKESFDATEEGMNSERRNVGADVHVFPIAPPIVPAVPCPSYE